MSKPLNIRQERFAELVAGGMTATDAYLKAGYKVGRATAHTNSARMLANAKSGEKSPIAARVEQTRAALIEASRKATTRTREEKLARLEEIAWDKTVKPSDTIAAIRAHNEMTGDNAPTKIINEDLSNKIASARERAKQLCSPLNRMKNMGYEVDLHS